MPQSAVIIVNWNGGRHLPGCLSALAAQTERDFTVWVVDNGSTDGSLDLLARAAAGDWPLVSTAYGPTPSARDLPPLRLLVNSANAGFAAGNNRALRAALADPAVAYCVPLNNDTVAHPDWLRALTATAAAHPQVGSLTGTLLFAGRPDRVASAGISVHRDGLALDRGVGGAVADLSRTPQPVFGVSAGAALYRRELLADVGLFDAAFFSYLEDADLAWRARLRGWRALWVPDAYVLHEVSATGGQGSPFKNYHLARNRIWCLIKNLPSGLWARYAPYILRYDSLALLYGLARRDWALIQGRAASLRDISLMMQQRRRIQAQRTVSDAHLARLLAPALSPWTALRARRDVDALLTER
ncbi:MAG: glycosyltransferase family 2 protein [Chloroflexota bacterium]|nr:glycosyltransferase family 2 protein [Chloroflexota bacterium]